ncbi:hypothetical protein IWW45_002318 [Coemansia sp. RSA 485]|nr:hypothetical protein IWW45_002318 [Coemansia sp. RSA 485]KAJ2603452.1 hypothetical protein GGF39_000176 [Coemansia sp. RSA 1721]
MRNYNGPQAMYPFVQVLSMVLLGVSLLIVTTTVCIRWLAFTIDRLGIKRHRLSGISGDVDNVRTAVAMYDRNGAFQGVRVRNSVDGDDVDIDNNNGDDDEDEDESLYELTQYSSLPLYPDLRRDFGVEILDLAGTCLQQYSNQVRSSGFSRQYGAMRVPLTTALDQYIDKAVTRIDGTDRQRQANRQQGQRSQKRAVRKPGSGLSVFIDDEPSVPIALQPSSASIAAALHDTRADAVRRLSVSVWSLCIALGTYALSRKMHVVGQVDENNSTGDVSGQNISKKQKYPHMSWRQSTSSSQQDISDGNETECFGQESDGLIDIDDLEWNDDDDDDDDDFDYVAVVDESDSGSETESGESGSNSVSRSERFNEAAELVSDLLDHPDDKDDGSQLLASATAFIAHSLLDGIFPGLSGVVGTRSRVMTRGMITRQLLSGDRAGTSMADQDHIGSVIVGPETLLAQMLSRITNNSMGQATGGTQQQQQQTVRYGELPFEPNEMESLAQLIHVKRQQHEQQPVATQANSDDGNSMVGDAVLCVICWANARSVMLRPCRCLCLCNDCRQALAARNFDHCPCCRRAVSGYSRVYAV